MNGVQTAQREDWQLNGTAEEEEVKHTPTNTKNGYRQVYAMCLADLPGFQQNGASWKQTTNSKCTPLSSARMCPKHKARRAVEMPGIRNAQYIVS